MIRIAGAVALVIATFAVAGCSRLGAFNTVIPQDPGSRLAEQDVPYGTLPRQTLDIYTPDAPGPHPVVVFGYGGSWNSGAKGDYGFVGRAFASRGYVTVIYDYRLVPQVRYPDFVQDGAAAIAWTYRNIASRSGDPERLFLAGHSAGAYNVMMAALDPAFLRREGLSNRIVRGVAGISGPYDFLPLRVDETREAFKGVADLPATQPINHAGDPGVPPVFLAHGRADDLVYPRNTEQLAAALRAAGRPVETRFYEGLGHVGALLAISRPLRSQAPVLYDVVAFLDRLSRRNGNL